MKFKTKYLIPCAVIAIAGGFAAHAQQTQQQASPGDTEQVKIERRNADMLKMAAEMLARDPNVLNRPIILTIDVGSRTDNFAFDKADQTFTRVPNASRSAMRISAEVPILRQCGIGFSYKGAEPSVFSELRVHNSELTDTLTIPDRGSVEVSMDMDANKNFVFPDSSQSSLESLQQETIKEGLKPAVENFNSMFAQLGYKIDLNNAQIEDTRDVYHQAQVAQQPDPDDFCGKIRADIKKSKLVQKNDSTINPFGSITASGMTDSSWSITYNAYTITISVIPTKI